MKNEIVVDGVRYVAAQSEGRRAVVVVDRGWIFAGDVTRVPATPERGRHLRLDRAVHVFSWQSVGFAAMLADPKAAKADLRPCIPQEIPEGSEIFCCPVGDSWGL
jgi:hypothetical protein